MRSGERGGQTSKIVSLETCMIRTFPLILGGEHTREICQKLDTLIVSQPMVENVDADDGGYPDCCLLCYNS